MEWIKYVAMSAIVVMCVACGGKSEEKGTIEERAFQSKIDVRTGVTRMQHSEAHGNVVMGGAEYHYAVNRVPCDSLPKVKDERGNLFVDNYIDLKITRNGNQKVLAKRFTKQTFAGQVDQKFLSKAILEGLVFDKEEHGKLIFAASVCYPQTDLFIPLKVTVSPNGAMHMERATMVEDEVPQGANE